MARGAVVITGASTGIGEACALHLDRLGFKVFAGVRTEQSATAIRNKASAELEPIFLDVADSVQIQHAAAAVERALNGGKLAGLVNNAGIAVPGPLEFLPLDELRRQFEINLFGQVAVTQAFLGSIRRGRGRVVNVGSMGGRVASPFTGAYDASKAALESMTDTLRRELKPWKVHVACVMPGSIATPIWEKGQREADAMLAKMPDEAHRLYGQDVDALRPVAEKTAARGIAPLAVAKAVAHALTASSPRAKYFVGTDSKIAGRLARLIPSKAFDAVVLSQTKTGKPR